MNLVTKRCPQCGTSTLTVLRRDTARLPGPKGVKVTGEFAVATCGACGHQDLTDPEDARAEYGENWDRTW